MNDAPGPQHDDRHDAREAMYKPSRGGAMHVVDAFHYSMRGIRAAWHSETAFRIHCLLFVFFGPLAFYVAETAVELALLLLACGLVLMAEMFNSAIETIVDRISTHRHPLSGQAKDLGSAGVFMTLVTFWAIWVPITWSRFAGG